MVTEYNTFALKENPEILVKAAPSLSSEVVHFCSIDGGHQFKVSKVRFEADFCEVSDAQIQEHVTPKSDLKYVALEDGPGYQAYIPSARWNGWAMPSFPADQALKLLHDMKPLKELDLQFHVKRGEDVISIEDIGYLKPSDVILITDPLCDEECDRVSEIKASTTHGETTWSIGAGSWIWSVVELDEDLLIEHIEFNMDINDYTLTDEIRTQALKLLAEENMDYKEIAKALVEPLGSSHDDRLDSDKPSSDNGLSM